jgi:hypothetical protein
VKLTAHFHPEPTLRMRDAILVVVVLWTFPSSGVLKRVIAPKHHLLISVKVKAKAYGGIETSLPSFLTPFVGG